MWEVSLTHKLVPLVTTGIFIAMAFIWGWLSDGPCRGARWPFVYVGAVITVITAALSYIGWLLTLNFSLDRILRPFEADAAIQQYRGSQDRLLAQQHWSEFHLPAPFERSHSADFM